MSENKCGYLGGNPCQDVSVRDVRIAKLEAEVKRLWETLEELLDGLDANGDERCGLTQKQWDERVATARVALKEGK